MSKKNTTTKTAGMVLVGLLILGLAGFGAGNIGGNIRSIGTVGDKPISTQSYFSAIQRQLSDIQRQTQQSMTFAQARELGVDRAVLQQLIAARALDYEASQLGLSVGDENVRDQVLNIGAFQGLDGSFDRESYEFALDQQGLTVNQFETTLREETARTLLQGAVVNGISAPDSFTNILINYAGEQRNFRWASLDASVLENALESASDAEVRAYYDDNTDQFTLPVTKAITYAWLTPDMLIDTVEVDDDALRTAYNERIDEFVQPERRLVERLVYLDETAASEAKAALDDSSKTFEALVDERGLELADIDLGDVGRLELDSAGEAVFGADVGDVVGPVASDLGPALFRVNGILPAQSVDFEDAKSTLRESVALQRAQRLIEQEAEGYDDLLAGGATLEELVGETELQLEQINWNQGSGGGIAAYESFRRAAAAVTVDDFPEIITLQDGGIVALRLDEELPERPKPYEDAKDAVSTALEASRTQDALTTRGEELAAQIVAGETFAGLGLTVTEEEGRTRGAFVPRTPNTFINDVFDMTPGDVQVIAGNGIVTIVELDSVAEPAENEETQQLRDSFKTQLDQALAQDLFQIFSNDVALRAETRIDQNAVEAVNVNFP